MGKGREREEDKKVLAGSMTEPRPRQHAFRLLGDLRPIVAEKLKEYGVPQHEVKLVLRHTANAVLKSLNARKK